MTPVTAAGRDQRYLLFIEAIASPHLETTTMTRTKFYSLIVSALLLAPFAVATLNQAAQIVA